MRMRCPHCKGFVRNPLPDQRFMWCPSCDRTFPVEDAVRRN